MTDGSSHSSGRQTAAAAVSVQPVDCIHLLCSTAANGIYVWFDDKAGRVLCHPVAAAW
jgi:hypothetical protein